MEREINTYHPGFQEKLEVVPPDGELWIDDIITIYNRLLVPRSPGTRE
jgi:hypothetical protein